MMGEKGFQVFPLLNEEIEDEKKQTYDKKNWLNKYRHITRRDRC